MAEPIHLFVSRTRIAYFSMEMALRPEMHTYAGGLGVLAGDTARSCADLELPVVFITLVSRAGYFRQEIDTDGRQQEEPDWWNPEHWCTPLGAMVSVRIENRDVWIRPWLYVHLCPHGHDIPVLLLDTDHDLNDPADHEITHHLYGGDAAYRLKQEIVLGIGGSRILRALGFSIETYHLNEGHAALLALDLLNHRAVKLDGKAEYNIARLRQRCVFTTHTPVEAGHDQFSYDLYQQLLPDFFDIETLKRLAGANSLNLTRLALESSGFINGVARRHAETARRLFPAYRISAITNGVHPGTWTHPAFAKLYDQEMPRWQHEPEVLVGAMRLSPDEVWRCHQTAKADLISELRRRTGHQLDPDLPILCFARRMTAYKRPMMLLADPERLAAIAERHPFHVVVAGKAHPRDEPGKEAIRQIHETARTLSGRVSCTFVPGYDMEVARLLVSGTDVWVNTPRPPMEASGTSGMKAAMNGILNLSVLDGWWAEGCVEGVTGWAIGSADPEQVDGDAVAQRELLDKLETVVLPLFHGDPARWRWMMTQAIGNLAYYFNSQRMMRRYASDAYLR
jgi:glycogen phosphorylase